MKHHILLKIACLCGMGMVAVSCDNYDDLYPQKYEKILMLKESGVRDITLYTTDEAATFPISIIKTGSNTDLPANVTLRPMTPKELEDYSNEYGTQYYAAIPSDCFSFKESGAASDSQNGIDFEYASADKYKLLNVYLNPTKVHDFTETLTGNQQAILPLVLVSETDSVSSVADKLFIRPEVIVPTIYFKVFGFNRYGMASVNAAGKVEVNIPIVMPIDNKWTFNCKAKVNPELLKEYNEANGTDYELLPEEWYTFGGTYTFTEGESNTNIKIEINKENLDLSSEYVLPIELYESELPGVDIDSQKGYCLAHISCKVALTEDMFSANSIALYDSGSPYDGVGLVGLIDGDGVSAGGLFHSGYGYGNKYDGVDATYGKYLDIHLPFSVEECKFDFMSRTQNANGVPKLAILYTSNDGKTWTELTQITTMNDVLTGGGMWASFGTYKSASGGFTYLRFAVITDHWGYDLRTDVGGSWNCQEFVLYAK